jgi:glucose-1-phosphate thymidylyltransferase
VPKNRFQAQPIAYADTLIRADFDLDPQADAVIWVKQVDQPEAMQ